jgi:hypothetical protein
MAREARRARELPDLILLLSPSTAQAALAHWKAKLATMTARGFTGPVNGA